MQTNLSTTSVVNTQKKQPNMSETTINQRLKFLIDSLNLKVGAFSRIIGVSETSTRNYTDRTSKPGSEYLEKIGTHFKQVNLTWLITGDGEPFLTDSPTATTHIKKITGGAVNSGTGDQHVTLEACQRELESTKRDAASLQKDNDSLREQLKLKDQLLEAKDETIALFRSTYNRPN